MAYKEISVQLPTDFKEDELRDRIKKTLNINHFTYQIENKSLDARNKNKIHWLIRVGVFSDELKGNNAEPIPSLKIDYKNRNKKVVVVGSGPAGFFSAFVLQKAGFDVTLIERGCDVFTRDKGIQKFENTGEFDSKNNYAFGEGGAGTFSDGKLTSRSKHISVEKQFILQSYIDAGAPQEIAYLAHPHVGSDNLKKVVKNLREDFIKAGGEFKFETQLTDVIIENGKIKEAILNSEKIDLDYLIIASGHSAFETYRMLIKNGIPFRTKNFAIGSRIEHPQEIINMAQWGKAKLPGVKAAEYRLTSNPENSLPVYTFCMCPGGIVVPATAYKNTNIVNGMSLYNRDAHFANAACVAGVSPDKLLGKETTALEMLDWLEKLEQSFFEFSNGYNAPYCSIQDFILKKEPKKTTLTSYPLGLKPAPLWKLLPEEVNNSIRKGLQDFCRKIKGFETGNIMGLESKTSSPIQVLRNENMAVTGFENLYIVGEGSGYAGGIISSGADGIKAAMSIIDNN
ncbi:MAG: NAD(P)/FAD-dependent oxidoreductase [Bacteroidales bacterium]